MLPWFRRDRGKHGAFHDGSGPYHPRGKFVVIAELHAVLLGGCWPVESQVSYPRFFLITSIERFIPWSPFDG